MNFSTALLLLMASGVASAQQHDASISNEATSEIYQGQAGVRTQPFDVQSPLTLNLPKTSKSALYFKEGVATESKPKGEHCRVLAVHGARIPEGKIHFQPERISTGTKPYKIPALALYKNETYFANAERNVYLVCRSSHRGEKSTPAVRAQLTRVMNEQLPAGQ